MKYLESPKRLPMKQLDVIGLRSVDGDMPYKELDALYSYIFSRVENLALTLKMLGFLFFRDHLYGSSTPILLAILVGLGEHDVHFHLSELHYPSYSLSTRSRWIRDPTNTCLSTGVSC